MSFVRPALAILLAASSVALFPEPPARNGRDAKDAKASWSPWARRQGLLAQAKAWLAMGDPEQALQEVERAYAQEPGTPLAPEALHLRGQCYQQLGWKEDALWDYSCAWAVLEPGARTGPLGKALQERLSGMGERGEGSGLVLARSGVVFAGLGGMETLRKPEPPHPEAKLRARVRVELLVDKDGTTLLTRAVPGLGRAEEARMAEQWAMGWRFKPVELEGARRQVRVRMYADLPVSSRSAATEALAYTGSGGGLGPHGTPVAEPELPGLVDVDSLKVSVALRPPPPPYPELARIAKVQGTVVVRVTMGTDGKPVSARAMEGPAQLRPAAEAYAMDWRFDPFRIDGKAVPVRFLLTVPFRLR